MTLVALADRILERALPTGPTGEAIRGDLLQERERIVREKGAARADIWYLGQAVSIWGFARRDQARGQRWSSGGYLPGNSERRQWGWGLADAVRGLRRAPGYSAAVVITLGVAMAATVSVFSVVRGVLLRDLPYPSPHEVVRFDAVSDGVPGEGGIDYPTVLDWQEGLSLLPAIAAFQGSSGVFVDEGVAEVWQGIAATRGFLTVLDLPLHLGVRNRSVDWELGARSIYLGQDLWERRFGADPDIVGRSIDFDEDRWEVAGVLPRHFSYPGFEVDYLVPLRLASWLDTRSTGFLRVVGRLAPEASLTAARSELTALMRGLEVEYPGEVRDVVLRRVADVETEPVRGMLWVFMGAVGFFMLVACANVSGLALARTESRRKELSIRLSLGASRARLARQLLVESLVLASLGGVLGVSGAGWGTRALIALAPADLPRRGDVGIDPVVLIFAAAVAVLAGVLFGYVPGKRGARIAEVRPGATRSVSRAARRTHRGLAAAQVALAVVLLSGSALLLRSFAALNAVDPGFGSPEDVLIVELGLGQEDYTSDEDVLAFHNRLLGGVSDLNAVGSAAVSTHLPFSSSRIQASVVREGQPYVRAERTLMGLEMVGGQYRQAMSLPLLRGRDAGTSPTGTESTSEVLMNEAGARLMWPDQEPLGKRFSFDVEEGQPSPESSLYTVVGIVPDVADGGLDEAPSPRAYYPLPDFLTRYSFVSGRFFYLIVRSEGDPRELIEPVRRVVRLIDPGVPLRSLHTLEELVRETTLPARFRTVALTVFAALAVVIALLGVYGVMAYSVATGVRDIGVRMALGARSPSVRGAVLAQSAKVVLAGALAGVVGAALLGPVLRSMLFQVSEHDPVSLAAVLLLTVAGSLLAAYVPALRASRVDPIEVLKSE